jgi:hypothetical protein
LLVEKSEEYTTLDILLVLAIQLRLQHCQIFSGVGQYYIVICVY